jgi:hypothetical protein
MSSDDQPAPPSVRTLEELLARQSFAIDEGDPEQWADTFTMDGTFSSPTYPLPAQGRLELIQFVRDLHSSPRQHRHWLGNIKLDFEDTEWVSRCYALIIGTDEGSSPELLRSLVITDRWRYENGAWRIRSRVVAVDGKPHAQGA